jgi:hypothetical protein
VLEENAVVVNMYVDEKGVFFLNRRSEEKASPTRKTLWDCSFLEVDTRDDLKPLRWEGRIALGVRRAVRG